MEYSPRSASLRGTMVLDRHNGEIISMESTVSAVVAFHAGPGSQSEIILELERRSATERIK